MQRGGPISDTSLWNATINLNHRYTAHGMHIYLTSRRLSHPIANAQILTNQDGNYVLAEDTFGSHMNSLITGSSHDASVVDIGCPSGCPYENFS